MALLCFKDFKVALDRKTSGGGGGQASKGQESTVPVALGIH